MGDCNFDVGQISVTARIGHGQKCAEVDLQEKMLKSRGVQPLQRMVKRTTRLTSVYTPVLWRDTTAHSLFHDVQEPDVRVMLPH